MFAEAIAYIAMQRSVPLTSTSGPNVIIVVVIIIIIIVCRDFYGSNGW